MSGCGRVCMCGRACGYINMLIYIYIYIYIHAYTYTCIRCHSLLLCLSLVHLELSQGALSLTGAKGKVDTGSQFIVFPDQLLPQLRDSITPRDVKKGGA